MSQTLPKSPSVSGQYLPPTQPPMSYAAQQYPASSPPAQQPPPQQQQFLQPQPQTYQTAVAIPNLGMGSSPVDCPSCGQRRMTRQEYTAGNTTHVWAGITFCLTGCLCFIPYMMNSLKDVKHHCGHCGVLLATWHKSGTTEAHMHH